MSKSKINFINLATMTTKDYEKVKDLPLNMVYRYTLKLIRTYPSVRRDAIREALLLDVQDYKKLRDEKEIEAAIYQARGFLHHLMTYELVMRELNRTDTNKFYHKVDLMANHMGIQNVEEKKDNKKDKEFEYF